MRRVLSLALGLLVGGVACAGPHSSGALWVQQYADQERTYFSTPDDVRRAQIVAFELSLVDEAIGAERQRLEAEVLICPGPLKLLSASSADVVRDGLRIQSEANQERLQQIAQLALMDWYLRRASATGDARFCERARTARSAPSTPGLLENMPAATVSRDQAGGNETPSNAPPLVTLSRYALGSLDTVTAPAPLPQYLAWVYGGTVLTDTAPVDAETAAAQVDTQAPGYPDWEPDALYAALRGARP